MLEATCIEVIKHKNNHRTYILQDASGITIDFNYNDIKALLKSGSLKIDNLALDVNGKIINPKQVQAECLELIRSNSGRITACKLRDTFGEVREFKAFFVKAQMKAENLIVKNLVITPSNKLEYKEVYVEELRLKAESLEIKRKEREKAKAAVVEHKRIMQDIKAKEKVKEQAKIEERRKAEKLARTEKIRQEKVNNIHDNKKSEIVKSVLNILENLNTTNDESVLTFKTACGHECYYVAHYCHKCILYIPDDVTDISIDNAGENKLSTLIRCAQQELIVAGGRNLISARNLFAHCNAKAINISGLYTDKLTDAQAMFKECNANIINKS